MNEPRKTARLYVQGRKVKVRKARAVEVRLPPVVLKRDPWWVRVWSWVKRLLQGGT